MTGKSAFPDDNALLAGIPAEQLRRLEPYVTRATLKEGKVIALAERPISHVYFPVTAVLSVLSVTSSRIGTETAVVGYEGMAPLAPFHHAPTTAEQIVVQVPGDALVVRREDFLQVLADSPALRERLHRFSQALFTFAAQSSACNRQHTIVQRCARWLLTTHDRVPGDDFYLTHQFLSQMLGVRRASVTVAAEALRASGAIEYTRGRVHVLNREILAQRACECYWIIRSTYDRLLAGVATPSPLAEVALADGDVSLVVGHAHDARTTPPDGLGKLSAGEMLADFGERLRETRRRTESLRTGAAPSGRTDAPRLLQLADELGFALEELAVAEEEMRVQMDALVEIRHALETQQAIWQHRFDGLPDAFLETDQDDAIIEVNRAAEILLGRPRSRILGKPITTLFPNTERSGVREAIHRLRAGQLTAQLSAPVIGGKDERPRVDVSVATAPHSETGSEGPNMGKPTYGGARWLMRPVVPIAKRSQPPVRDRTQ